MHSTHSEYKRTKSYKTKHTPSRCSSHYAIGGSSEFLLRYAIKGLIKVRQRNLNPRNACINRRRAEQQQNQQAQSQQ